MKKLLAMVLVLMMLLSACAALAEGEKHVPITIMDKREPVYTWLIPAEITVETTAAGKLPGPSGYYRTEVGFAGKDGEGTPLIEDDHLLRISLYQASGVDGDPTPAKKGITINPVVMENDTFLVFSMRAQMPGIDAGGFIYDGIAAGALKTTLQFNIVGEGLSTEFISASPYKGWIEFQCAYEAKAKE